MGIGLRGSQQKGSCWRFPNFGTHTHICRFDDPLCGCGVKERKLLLGDPCKSVFGTVEDTNCKQMDMGHFQTTRGPQALVHVSVCQGSILDPQPNRLRGIYKAITSRTISLYVGQIPTSHLRFAMSTSRGCVYIYICTYICMLYISRLEQNKERYTHTHTHTRKTKRKAKGEQPTREPRPATRDPRLATREAR